MDLKPKLSPIVMFSGEEGLSGLLKVALSLIYTLINMEKQELKRREKVFKGHHADNREYEYIISLLRRNGNIGLIN